MAKITMFVEEVTYVGKEVEFDLPGVDVDDALLTNVNDVLANKVYTNDVTSVDDILKELREGFGFDAEITSEKKVSDVAHSIHLNDVY